MKSMRPVTTIILASVCLGGFSACSSVLINAPVSKTADGWVVTLKDLKEGPDEYVGEAVTLRPGKDEKYIWAVLTVRSEAAEEQTFSYDACTLGDKTQATRPVFVDRNEELPSTADREEAFGNGQERTRKLIYRYPEDLRPTRMICGSIVLPIPSRR